jgi:protein TonB
MFSSISLSIVLMTALVTSLFSIDLSLGVDDFELVRLMAPVEQPMTEPESPASDDVPQQSVESEQTVTRLPTRPAIRQVNMARVDESPRSVPKSVSVRPSTFKARPASKYFGIGKLDFDPGTGAPSGVIGGRKGTGSGTGSSSGHTAVTEQPTSPPPPPIKKTPREAPIAKKRVRLSLGVINGKATRLPKPAYPPAARAVLAKGTVRVRVLIDENGRVVSANAIAGHPLLRNAAVVAARGARFRPTLLSGEPIKASGVIIYNFLG